MDQLKTAEHLLRRALDDPAAEFRPGQWEAIKGLLESRRQLVVQRTGWGKSMVYFLSTRLLRDQGRGLTLLISPLLSLMRNQILAAERIGIHAETINSTNNEDWDAVYERLQADEVDLLLISPERLANDRFRNETLIPIAEHIGLFVVDEAHCISDWGHDFRPDYRRIVRILDILPSNIPVLATTATANDRVVSDVAAQLGDVEVVRGPLTRRSLMLQNIHLPGQSARMAWLAENVPKMPGSGIIYTLTKRDAERVAGWLISQGIEAVAYHGGMDDRNDLEELLLENRLKALVATVALGMGFDKPDLGFVIHYQRPGSVVHYYQQVGRAGRAVDQAFGILLGGAEDDDIVEFFLRTAFPPQAHVDEILGALREAEAGLSISMLEASVNLSRKQIEKTVKFLAVESPSPIMKEKSRWYALPVEYRMDQEKIDRLWDVRRGEQLEMQRYLGTTECLMQFLAKTLDDPYAEPCGRCANCVGKPLLPESFDPASANAAGIYLRKSHQPIRPRKRWVSGAFPEYGFSKTISQDHLIEEGRGLCLWGDAGWGELVHDGKYRHERFDDELVAGCVEMIEEWGPTPAPRWVTCVPSLRTGELVPDFAQRLARSLGLKFVPAVRKTRRNQPQKEMHNSYLQASNLDGVFAVEDDIPEGPVLLIDDMVDSRWTFTVIGALLRQAGCPAVFPLALGVATPGA